MLLPVEPPVEEPVPPVEPLLIEPLVPPIEPLVVPRLLVPPLVPVRLLPLVPVADEDEDDPVFIERSSMSSRCVLCRVFWAQLLSSGSFPSLM